MKFGFIIPGGTAHEVVNLASEAERSRWDGVFYYDDVYVNALTRVNSAWPILSAISVTTKKIKIGSLLTAVVRRRPWDLARESVTVDHLSHGRLILPVGLGAVHDGGYSKVGMPTDRKIRAELLDEGLEIIDGLWTGKPFRYNGKHYKMKTMIFKPRPFQRPRIPIWVVGAWPRPKSMQRALKYDGVIPVIKRPDGSHEEVTPEKIREIREFVLRNRKIRKNRRKQFDIVKDGKTPINQKRAKEMIEPFAEAGATWWMESMWGYKRLQDVRERIRAGPPALS